MSLSLSSSGQQQALAIVPKVTGLLSAALSGLIASVICRDPTKRSKVYHRLILGMSLADISSSLWLSLSTWPIPAETGILWAVGTVTSCNFQGFFTQFGISSPLYNLSLSIYYVLAVRFGWREERLKKVELYFHVVPVSWALGTAIAGLPLEIFNSANLWCWIADDTIGDRNSSTNIYRWVFFYGPLWTAIVVVTICLWIVFAFVRSVTLQSERHSMIRPPVPTTTRHFRPQETSDMAASQPTDNDQVENDVHNATKGGSQKDEETSVRLQGVEDSVLEESSLKNTGNDTSDKMSVSQRFSAAITSLRGRRNSLETTPQFAKRRREVAYQCLRYALAFYWTWIPISILRILQTANAKPVYALFFLAAMNTPFQGLPNCLAYLYPRFVTVRKANPNTNFVKLVRLSLAPEAQLSSTSRGNEGP
jgi:hypothetical protein